MNNVEMSTMPVEDELARQREQNTFGTFALILIVSCIVAILIIVVITLISTSEPTHLTKDSLDLKLAAIESVARQGLEYLVPRILKVGKVQSIMVATWSGVPGTVLPTTQQKMTQFDVKAWSGFMFSSTGKKLAKYANITKID